MPDPIKMDGQYACRIAPYDPVRVICVDGPGDHPVAYYDADGGLNGADRYGVCYDTNYDLIPLRRKPVEACGYVNKHGSLVGVFYNRAAAETWRPNYLDCRLVRLVEAEDGA